MSRPIHTKTLVKLMKKLLASVKRCHGLDHFQKILDCKIRLLSYPVPAEIARTELRLLERHLFGSPNTLAQIPCIPIEPDVTRNEREREIFQLIRDLEKAIIRWAYK